MLNCKDVNEDKDSSDTTLHYLLEVILKLVYSSFSNTVMHKTTWTKNETLKECVFVGFTTALGVTSMKDGIQQILFTDEADFCHSLFFVFRGQ